MRTALLVVLVGCAHATTSDGRAELAKARVATAKGQSAAFILYERVPRFSASWPRALLEGSRERVEWRYYSIALGQLMTLRAPQLSHWVFPEAYTIEAQIYFANCYYARASAIAEQFRAKVLPLRERVRQLMMGAPLGEREDVRIMTRIAGTAGEQRWNELDRLLVEIEMAEIALAKIEQESQEKQTRLVDNDRLSKSESIMIVDEDNHLWHFDGEWWPDELGNYRVRISSRCVRRNNLL